MRTRMGSAAATVTAISSVIGLMLPGSAAAASGYDRCPAGDVCFFSENDGGGNMCAWDGSDRNWGSGLVVCGGVATPRSIFNNGTTGNPDDVAYYRAVNYGNRVGCTSVGHRGNLAGNYQVKSHQWVSSC